MAVKLTNKKDKLAAFQDLIREEGWDVYQERIDLMFQSAVQKSVASTPETADYNRGYYDCVKLVRELKTRIVEENKEESTGKS